MQVAAGQIMAHCLDNAAGLKGHKHRQQQLRVVLEGFGVPEGLGGTCVIISCSTGGVSQVIIPTNQSSQDHNPCIAPRIPFRWPL